MNEEEIAWARKTFEIEDKITDEEVVKVVSTTYALAFHRADIALKKLGAEIRKGLNANGKSKM